MHKNSKPEVETYWKKLQCIDADEDVQLNGDYNSYKARVLKIAFEKCDREKNPIGFCATEEEITDFLKRKFIMIIQNQFRFQTSEYDEDRIVQESKLVWFPITSNIR